MFDQMDKIFELNGTPQNFNTSKEKIPSLAIQQKYLEHLKTLA
jgi:hypothetical protein